MGFWIFMLIMNLMMPLMMIAVGWLFIKKPPKAVNGVYGYRTRMSMKNKDTWDFAHQYCGRLWYKVGWILLPLCIIAMLFVLGKDEDMIGTWGAILCMLQTIPMIATIFPTERALKNTFDERGIRKN